MFIISILYQYLTLKFIPAAPKGQLIPNWKFILCVFTHADFIESWVNFTKGLLSSKYFEVARRFPSILKTNYVSNRDKSDFTFEYTCSKRSPPRLSQEVCSHGKSILIESQLPAFSTQLFDTVTWCLWQYSGSDCPFAVKLSLPLNTTTPMTEILASLGRMRKNKTLFKLRRHSFNPCTEIHSCCQCAHADDLVWDIVLSFWLRRLVLKWTFLWHRK